MSSLIARLRGWLSSLFAGRSGGDGASDAGRTDAETTDTTYECTICGTETDQPESGCPLCGSADLAPLDDGRDGSESVEDAQSGDDRPAERLAGDATQTVRSEDGDEDAVDRLRALRDDRE